MNFSELPKTCAEFMAWTWEDFEPYYSDLAARHLDSSNIVQWLKDWTELSRLSREILQRLYVGITVDTTDEVAANNYEVYLDNIHPRMQAAEQVLKQMLLQSALIPEGMEVPVRNTRAEAAIFRESNLPLLSEELKLETEYDKIIGAQTICWEGSERTITQLEPIYQLQDRDLREKAWRMGIERQLADRQAINELWTRLMQVRVDLGANAGFTNYRDYR